jgi:group II intron reverse transcriptase/maturase
MVDGVERREGEEPQSAQCAFEESDAVVVPRKSTKTWVTPVEPMEERTAAKGKSAARNALPAQDGASALTLLQRIGQRAKESKEEKFTTLLSHMKVPLLKEAFTRLRKDAASGVDGTTWIEYAERLDEKLLDLQDRVHRGSYHPQPVRRVFIPKGDGKMRPLGIPALEDKIVQQAARMVLEPIYEAQFLGFSYGFRPGRSQHDALDALAEAIHRKVSWVLDADIRSFFDTIDHGCMKQFLEHRIGDRRMVRLLMKWLRAGVMEDGELRETVEGTPQGGIISPLLANIYLHYALDLWVQQWRKRHARGELYFVRYADDFVACLQHEEDALAMREALAERLAKFGLELHSDKTRVIRFGRFAREKAARQGRKPETFDFLGFTHIAGCNRDGRFQLKRRTSRKKRRAKLAALKAKMRQKMHEPPVQQHKWLAAVLRGHYRYYAVPTNYRALAGFRRAVQHAWYRVLQRRGQRARWNVEQLKRFEQRFQLPVPRILHPWPEARFADP